MLTQALDAKAADRLSEAMVAARAAANAIKKAVKDGEEYVLPPSVTAPIDSARAFFAAVELELNDRMADETDAADEAGDADVDGMDETDGATAAAIVRVPVVNVRPVDLYEDEDELYEDEDASDGDA